MSQSGFAKISSNVLPPQVPTSFVTDAGTAIPAANILNVLGGTGISTSGAGNTVTITADVTQDLHTARYIVSAGGTADGANYTTIASAIAAAAATGSAQTVFIQPGTYIENLTLSPNINLSAFACDAQNQTVTIRGKLTATSAGLYSINGINLATNGDYVLQITGSNALTVYLINCYITATNANAINCTNSSAGVQLYRCNGNVGINTYFVYTGGGMSAYYCVLASSNSTTASTFSSSSCAFICSSMYCPVTTSGTGSFSGEYSFFNALNTTCLTTNGSGSSFLFQSRVEAGTGSAISIGAGATLPVLNTCIFSSNVNAITGLGTLKYAFVSFYGSSSTVNTSTVTPYATLI
jgi:hypothetical protein